ncbi:MAG: helix-turn-helix domain-containing protein [bacterium]|nr:helix-turn-helix domain-containing protein [bacterium]
MYKKELMDAGLTHKQAQVYIACLEAGPSKIPQIATAAQIKRTTVYGIVEELEAMDLVKSRYKGKQKLYEAQDPALILSMLEEKKKRVAEVLPGLSNLFITHHVRPKIAFFEGREGVKKIYDDALDCQSKEIKQIVRARQHNEVVGDAFINEFIKKRIARGIITRNLHPKHGDLYTNKRGMEDPKLKRYVRYLPPSVFYAAIIMIYDHKVAMVSTKEENFGFIIESKEFSNTLSAYFDFMWGLGSKTPDLD